jgi:hypothetical protein
MNIASPRFSGLYIKLADNTPSGLIGHSRTKIEVVVTNDPTGNHLDKYQGIVGAPPFAQPEEANSIGNEHVFQFEDSDDGWSSTIAFRAGGTIIDKSDPTKKALITELLNELPNLYPPIKQTILQRLESYFKQ